MTLPILLACCLYCAPPTAADPWQDRDRIPKELIFPPAERERVRAGYPYFERQFAEPYRNELPEFRPGDEDDETDGLDDD